MRRIEARLVVNNHLLDVLAETGEPGKTRTAVEIDLLKDTIADNAREATRDAVGLCGNHALTRANPLERHLRDVLCATIHTPRADSAYIAAGRARPGL
jgi:alkylation response protein AidB-like acyl-CoA dehydrogenase